MSSLSKVCKSFIVLVVIFGLASVIGCGEAMVKAGKAPEGWTLQFSDNFERADIGDGWKVLGGDWSIKDGWLTAPGMGWGASEIMCTKKFPGGQRLEFDARSDNPTDLTAVICADTSYWDGYFVGFGSNGNTHSKLLIQGGYEVKVWDTIITPGKTHRVVAQRDGNTITHIVDGETVMTYEDQYPLKGEYHQKVGLYIWTSGQIDNVKVYTKPE